MLNNFMDTVEAGKKGGMKTRERGSDYYRAIQRKGLAVRRRNKMLRAQSARNINS